MRLLEDQARQTREDLEKAELNLSNLAGENHSLNLERQKLRKIIDTQQSEAEQAKKDILAL